MVKRIIEALEKIEINDFENALIQISIGIDSVAKKKYPKLKSAERCIRLIENYRDFIYRFCTCGKIKILNNGNIIYSDFEGKNLGEILYKVIRCGLIHEGKLPKNQTFLFGEGYGIGACRVGDSNSEFGFLVSRSLLVSLCLIIIENDTIDEFETQIISKDIICGDKTIKIENKTWLDNDLTNSILTNLMLNQ